MDLTWLEALLVSPAFALLAGLVIQMYGVQRVKFWLPIEWSDFKRRRAIELLGMLFGYLPTAAILAGQGCPSYQVIWLPIIVAVAGPVGWKVATAILYRQRPELEGRLSAHGRAVRQNKPKD